MFCTVIPDEEEIMKSVWQQKEVKMEASRTKI